MRRLAAALAAIACLAVPHTARAQEVEAHLDRSRAVVGESVTLTVTVSGGRPSGDPQFDLPSGLTVLGSGRQENLSWINGKASASVEFRYELGVENAGHFAVGPILVRVGSRAFESGTLRLDASAAPQSVGGARSRDAVSLIVEAEPMTPFVGQAVTLRVRLVQRQAFADDPQYTPPATTGFWTGSPTAPESYYADEGGQRVLVTETRARLYPLAAGDAVIGEASASVVLAGPSGGDPFGWLSGTQRQMRTVTSRPLVLKVRPLPVGAPQGFTGAVGVFSVVWNADRARTGRDVPFTLMLDVRGRGNLPLVRPPMFSADDLEVLASSIDDSLGDPANGREGRKRFQWTVLARRQGTLDIPAPAFVSFDPLGGGYHLDQPDPVRMEVGPAVYGAGSGVGTFPVVFAERPIDPEPRRPRPWAFAIAGVLAGLAIALVRASLARPARSAERAQGLEWLRAVGRTSGPDFWRAADDATTWLAASGSDVSTVREQVASARYGGSGSGDPERIRRQLVERLSRSLPPEPPRMALRVGAAVALVAAGVTAFLLGFAPPPPRPVIALAGADARARSGDIRTADQVWRTIWRSGVREPGLAARIAWAALERSELGESCVWVLRGRRIEPRDAGLEFMAGRLREGGGLLGAGGPYLPIRTIEWGILALVLGVAAGWAWPRLAFALPLLIAAMLAGCAPLLMVWADESTRPAVVVRELHVGSEGLELLPGQVVQVREFDRTRARVAAGRAVEGWVPADGVMRVQEGAEPGGGS